MSRALRAPRGTLARLAVLPVRLADGELAEPTYRLGIAAARGG